MLNKDEMYLALLCDRTNPAAAELHGDKIPEFSDDGLYKCVHRSNWSKMSEKNRLRVLQEFENRQARRDGRKPITIIAEEMEDGCYGYHSTRANGEEVIGLNINLIRCSPVSIYTAADALETVIHEGRHAFQHNCCHKKDRVPEQIRLEWSAVMQAFGGAYMQPEKNFLIYVMQSIEMDARRYARRRIEEISSRLAELGMTDAHFDQASRKLLEREKRYLAWVRESITLEQIDVYEKLVLEIFHLNNPNLKLNKLKLFDHVRLILTRKDIDNLQELVELLDRTEDEKMDMLPEKKLNRIPEKMPEKLSGLGGRFGG